MRFCLMLLFVMVLSPFAHAGKAIRIAVDNAYPPFASLDASGQLVGFDVDIARALCTELKIECELKAMTFGDIIPAMVAGDIDVSIAGMGATEERKKLVDFTGKYYRSHTIFVERSGSTPAGTALVLEGKRIGAQQGTVQEWYLSKNYSGSIQLIPTESFVELFDELRSGKLDLIMVDGLSTYTYLKSPAGEGMEAVGEALQNEALIAPSYIAVSKKLPQVREKFDAGIQAIRRSGEYAKINRKYFDFNIY